VAIQFRNRQQQATILDPQKGYEETTLSLETRWDPLTQRTARVLDLPIKKLDPFDIEEFFKETGNVQCPFCPGALEEVTPRFTDDFIKGGQLRSGEVRVFPNKLPFDRYCAVVVLTRQHYVPLTDFSEERLFNGLSAAHAFLCRLIEVDPAARFFSINWNYLPMSGGSVIHPHLQVIAGDVPTHYQGEMIQAGKRHQQQWGTIFWDELAIQEQEAGERYLGAVGNTIWLTSYAPLGFVDIMTIFRERPSIIDLSEQDLRDFSQGLLKVFHYFHDFNHYSFNLGIYSGEHGGDDSFWVNARMVTRRLLPPVGASDVSYFEKLHGESIGYKKPERLCEELKVYF
jgi:UDPglucose--hexose-1-phosphate uridylyltransferase